MQQRGGCSGRVKKAGTGPVLHTCLTSLVLLVILLDSVDAEKHGLSYWLLVATAPCSFSLLSCTIDFLVLLIATELLYFKCVSMDPGIVKATPKRRRSDPGSPNAIKSDMNKWDSKSSPDHDNGSCEPHPPMVILPRLWCYLCDVDVPLRCRHCLDCGHCVSRFDHHCPWVGQCVGRRSHRVFWAFLLAQAFLLFSAIQMLWHSVRSLDNFSSLETWLWRNTFLLLALLVCTMALACCVPLLLFHSWLVLTEQTTWEFVRSGSIKYRGYFRHVSPFDRGAVSNVRRFILPATAACDELDNEDTTVWWLAFERRCARLAQGLAKMTEPV